MAAQSNTNNRSNVPRRPRSFTPSRNFNNMSYDPNHNYSADSPSAYDASTTYSNTERTVSFEDEQDAGALN